MWGVLEYDHELRKGRSVLVGLKKERAPHMAWLMNRMDQACAPQRVGHFTYCPFDMEEEGHVVNVKGIKNCTWTLPSDFLMFTDIDELRTLQMVFVDEYVPAMERKVEKNKVARDTFELDKRAFTSNIKLITDYSKKHGLLLEAVLDEDEEEEEGEIVDPLNRWKSGDIDEIKRRREAERKKKERERERALKQERKVLKIKMKRERIKQSHRCLDFDMRGYFFIELGSFLSSAALRGCDADTAAMLREKAREEKFGEYEKKSGLHWVPYKRLEEFLSAHARGVTLSVGFANLKERIKRAKHAYVDKWYKEQQQGRE